MHEYVTHVVPVDPGHQGATTAILNDFASQGWRLVDSFCVPLQQGSALSLEGPRHGLGLFVVLEREKALQPALSQRELAS